MREKNFKLEAWKAEAQRLHTQVVGYAAYVQELLVDIDILKQQIRDLMRQKERDNAE